MILTLFILICLVSIYVLFHDAAYCGFFGKEMQNRVHCGAVHDVSDRKVAFLIARYKAGQVKASYVENGILILDDGTDKIGIRVKSDLLDPEFGNRMDYWWENRFSDYSVDDEDYGGYNISYATKTEIYELATQLPMEEMLC